MSIIIRAQDLSYCYPTKTALDNVNFEIRRGEFSALLGPNGAGKTTLFSLLSQFLNATSGTLEYLSETGKPIYGREALKTIGFVFQQTTLDLDLSVEQNLYYHASLHGISPKEAKKRIKEELSRMDMGERLTEKVRNLNGGHKRRVEIARALLHRPSILLLDEPTVGLDMTTREYINQYIRSLSSEHGTTTLYTTHLLDEIDLSDNVILLDRGKIKKQGTCADIINGDDTKDLRALFFNDKSLNQ
jgi:ABC-2 type transport system ATP-binding protein